MPFASPSVHRVCNEIGNTFAANPWSALFSLIIDQDRPPSAHRLSCQDFIQNMTSNSDIDVALNHLGNIGRYQVSDGPGRAQLQTRFLTKRRAGQTKRLLRLRFFESLCQLKRLFSVESVCPFMFTGFHRWCNYHCARVHHRNSQS